ncbi:MAG: DUF2853 family protein, partial [Sphingomonadaceae bacterium]
MKSWTSARFPPRSSRRLPEPKPGLRAGRGAKRPAGEEGGWRRGRLAKKLAALPGGNQPLPLRLTRLPCGMRPVRSLPRQGRGDRGESIMGEDWAADVRKYAPDAPDDVIQGIIRHCGIALRTRDASLVAFTDKAETDLVRESFLKKKLGLTQSDEELDAAIAMVGERMKEDRTKNRVTVYYLLAEHFGKLGLFGGAAAATAAAAAPAPEPEPEPEPVAVPVAADPVVPRPVAVV